MKKKHRLEIALQVVIVHREVRKLENVSIVASVNRVACLNLFRCLPKCYDLLVVCGVGPFELFVFHGVFERVLCNVGRVAVASGRGLPMEEEFERSQRPRGRTVLVLVKVVPLPVS